MDEQTSLGEDLFGEVSESDVAEMTVSDNQNDTAEATEASAENVADGRENGGDENGLQKEGPKEAVGGKAPDTYKVKYLGEEKALTLEELTVAAQKGLDYDRIRMRDDELRQKISAIAGNGVSVEQYLDNLSQLQSEQAIAKRAQELVNTGNYSEVGAREFARLEYERQNMAEMRAREQAQNEAQSAAKKQIGAFIMQNPAFMQRFPDAQMPKEMVEAMDNGATIGEAWKDLLLREQEGKLAEMEKRIAEMEQRSKNAKAAAPSVHSDESGEKDTFLAELFK